MDPAAAVDIGRRVGRRICPTGPWADDVASAAIEAAWMADDNVDPGTAAWRAAVVELRRLTKYRRSEAPTRTNASRWVDDVVSLDAATRLDEGRTLADMIGAEDHHSCDDELGVDLLPHQARVVALLGLGYSKTDAAHILGVTPSAVSYTLAQLRRTITRGQDGIEAA